MKNQHKFLLAIPTALLGVTLLSACQSSATPEAPATTETGTTTAPVDAMAPANGAMAPANSAMAPASDAMAPTDNAATSPAMNAGATNAVAMKTPKADNGCYVHMFDDDNFGDDNDVIYGPGKFFNLKNLPDATESDWGGEADSLKVGPSATVKVWDKDGYRGQTRTFRSSMNVSTLDIEIKSLEISCG